MKNLKLSLAGTIICLIGFYFWIANYYPNFNLFDWLNIEKNWPLALIIVGFFLIIKQYNDWKE